MRVRSQNVPTGKRAFEEREEGLIVGFAQTAIAERGDDADDLDVGPRVGPISKTDARADR